MYAGDYSDSIKSSHTAIPETCTYVVATYSIGGDRHTIKGHPADLYVQLDVLCSISRNFRFHGWK